MPNPFFLRALIIEDDPMAQQILAGFLEASGMVVLFADTLAGAISLAARTEPHLVFIDLDLPDGRGEKLIRRARLEPSLSQAMLVVVTGDTDDETRSSVLKEGGDQFLVKPVSAAQIQAVIVQARERVERVSA